MKRIVIGLVIGLAGFWLQESGTFFLVFIGIVLMLVGLAIGIKGSRELYK